MSAIKFDKTLITTSICLINLVGILWQDQGIFSTMNNYDRQGACRCTIQRRDLFQVKPTGGLYFLLYLGRKLSLLFFRKMIKYKVDEIVFKGLE
jgi:hypothetical protein